VTGSTHDRCLMKIFYSVASIALLLGGCQTIPAGLPEAAIPMPASDIQRMYAGKTVGFGQRPGGQYLAADGSFATWTVSNRTKEEIAGVGTWSTTDGKMCADVDYGRGALTKLCWSHWSVGNEFYARYDGATWPTGSEPAGTVYRFDPTRDFRSGNTIARDVSRIRSRS
jgi:hypothetical protein